MADEKVTTDHGSSPSDEEEVRTCPECGQNAFKRDEDFGCWYCTWCDYEREF